MPMVTQAIGVAGLEGEAHRVTILFAPFAVLSNKHTELHGPEAVL